MKIRRFTPRPGQPKPKPKPKPQLPQGAFRVEFFCLAEENFPVGEWYAAVLYADHVEYRKIPLAGYQPVNRLVSRLSDSENVDGKVVLDLVSNHETKIMSLSLTDNNSPG